MISAKTAVIYCYIVLLTACSSIILSIDNKDQRLKTDCITKRVNNDDKID